MNEEMVNKASWLEKLKNSFNLEYLKEKLSLSKQTVTEIAISGGVGFVCGFLLKRYAHFIFLLVLFGIGILGAQQAGIISMEVNWEQLRELFGIHASSAHGDLVAIYWEWIKLNLPVVISFTIGLLLGLKFG
jgi:uncharacterized membrane protein (Fun14 family)